MYRVENISDKTALRNSFVNIEYVVLDKALDKSKQTFGEIHCIHKFKYLEEIITTPHNGERGSKRKNWEGVDGF